MSLDLPRFCVGTCIRAKMMKYFFFKVVYKQLITIIRKANCLPKENLPRFHLVL